MRGGFDGVPREVLKWLHDINVPFTGRHLKWEMASGILVAQILETSFPGEVQALMFDQGMSLDARRHNWEHILHLCRKFNIVLSRRTVEECIFLCHESCVEVLNDLYSALTSRSAESLKAPIPSAAPPSYTTPTATQLLKNVLLYINPDETETNTKTQAIVNKCSQRRIAAHQERLLRLYAQWLPLGANKRLFLPTKERPSSPPPQAPPNGLQFTPFEGSGRAGLQRQTQQQPTVKEPQNETASNKPAAPTSRSTSGSGRAASSSSLDSD